MALSLYEHNWKAYQAAKEMLERYGKAAIIHPTGTGKSYVAFQLIADHSETVVFWLSPSEYIFSTQLDSLKKNAPDIRLDNVRFYTYAKLMCSTDAQLEQIAEQRPGYIVLDEFHRVGASCWGAGTMKLLSLCPDAKLLGLTATNVRYLDHQRDMAQEVFEGYVASEMTLGEAIVRGILPAPKYVTTVYKYQKDLARYQARVDGLRSAEIRDVNQQYMEALRRALEQADGLDKVFAHHITKKNGKYIVFCASKEHMDEMIAHVPEWFAGVNRNTVVYEAYSDDPGTDKALAAFKADETDRLKLLFCIDMLNEGIHVEGISGVILFRPTISPIVYKQQIGRALTAGNQEIPLILDIVNNFEGLCSISGLQDEMAEAMHRLTSNGEGDKVVAERFEVVEQVHDCRVLFERLQQSLNSTWEHYYAQARNYFAEHGNLKIPKRYMTSTGLSLGEWIVTQRKIHSGQSAGSLSEQQIARLNEIGMIWENRTEAAWNHGYAAAQKYQKEYGNLAVPVKYKDNDGYSLGGWIVNTRQNRVNGRLSEEQIRQLDALGMVWNTFDARWERGYALAMQYAAEHGDLNVPADYVTPEGENIGAWIRNQRSAYLKKRLSEEQIARLEQIGMFWGNRNDQQWNEGYQAARRYFEAYGNLNVPVDYRSPEGYSLGKWVRRQQYVRLHPEKANAILTPERITLLNSIGMCWERVDPWKHRLNLARAYRVNHGNLTIPAKYKTEDGIWLGRWLYEQKKLLRSGSAKLTSGQRKEIGELLGEM